MLATNTPKLSDTAYSHSRGMTHTQQSTILCQMVAVIWENFCRIITWSSKFKWVGHTLPHLWRLLVKRRLLFFDSCSTILVLLLANRCFHRSQYLHKQQLRSNFNTDHVLAETEFTTTNKGLDSPQQEMLSDYFWHGTCQADTQAGGGYGVLPT